MQTLLALTSALVTCFNFMLAPVGYEDERGFHYGVDPRLADDR